MRKLSRQEERAADKVQISSFHLSRRGEQYVKRVLGYLPEKVIKFISDNIEFSDLHGTDRGTQFIDAKHGNIIFFHPRLWEREESRIYYNVAHELAHALGCIIGGFGKRVIPTDWKQFRNNLHKTFWEEKRIDMLVDSWLNKKHPKQISLAKEAIYLTGKPNEFKEWRKAEFRVREMDRNRLT